MLRFGQDIYQWKACIQWPTGELEQLKGGEHGTRIAQWMLDNYGFYPGYGSSSEAVQDLTGEGGITGRFLLDTLYIDFDSRVVSLDKVREAIIKMTPSPNVGLIMEDYASGRPVSHKFVSVNEFLLQR